MKHRNQSGKAFSCHAYQKTLGALAFAVIVAGCSSSSSVITFKKGAEKAEAGRPYDLNAMVDSVKGAGTGTVTCTTDLDTDVVGTYHGACEINGQKAEIEIEVVDTTPPDLQLHNVTAGIDEEVDAESFVTSCMDASRYALTILNPDALVNARGSRTVEIEAVDEYGNSTRKKATLRRSDVTDVPEQPAESSKVLKKSNFH